MDYFVLIIGILFFPVGIFADYGTTIVNTSVTSTTWFWPLLSICLALLLSVPCTLITIIILCHNKKQDDDTEESTIHSSESASSSATSSSYSSSVPTPIHRPPMHHHYHHHCRLPRSHYPRGFRSPPPPYAVNQQPGTRFIAPSLPPPYESHVSANDVPSPTLSNPPTTIINVEPADSTINQSSTTQPVETTVDISSTVTNQSIQTFHA